MRKNGDGSSVFDAKVWQTVGFDEVLHKSKLGYSDGTDGTETVRFSIEPAAFGAATFNFSVVSGKNHHAKCPSYRR